MKLGAVLLVMVAGFGVFAGPEAIAKESVFDVIGVIRAPLDRDGQIVVSHRDIPGYMPAMTMAFAVADRDEAAALKPGDRVEFRLHVSETASSASDFTIVGRETLPTQAKSTAGSGKRLREGDSVPEFALTTETNQPLAAADLRGRLTVVTFIFTRCPVPEYCPAMALRFGQLQRAILNDPALSGRARLLSITLDPEFDRPEVLKAYGSAVGANPAVWQFATGTPAEIESLTKAFAVYTERNGVTLNHTLCTALIDADGRIIDLWRGNGWNVDEVLTALRNQR